MILYIEYHAARPDVRSFPSAIENPFFVATGKWGIRFLLLSLLMSPLHAFTGWNFPLKLRKPFGLVAFGFVSVHVSIHLFSKWTGLANFNFIERITEPWYVLLGLAAFIILALMAITSVKPTMKLMGRFWKPLHRLVYAAGILIMAHSIIAATSGKRAFAGGEESFAELRIYLVLLIVLLVVRVPLVKYWLQVLLPFAPNPRKSKRKRSLQTG
jgi:sulfoxide reductase heme-binding subunit YedZ